MKVQELQFQSMEIPEFTAYHSYSKETRESKLIRGASASASSQFCYSLKLVISVLKHIKCGTFYYIFSETVPFVDNVSLFSVPGSSFRCERENTWGLTQIFQCPEDGDASDKIFCCGFGDNKYCCSTQINEDVIEEFFDE